MFQLLALLNDGEFHSGEEIGRILGVSRAAVWKKIEAAEQSMGLTIQRVKGRGYQLEQSEVLLDQTKIAQATELDVVVKAVVDSTNLLATELLEQKKAPFVVMAEQQNAGRGRRGREWVSPPAQNIYLSMVWPVTDGISKLEGLSLVVGLALYRVLKRCFPNEMLGVKWPNDLLLNGKKCAGILLEIVGDPADRYHVIIGVGINVNMQQAEIDQKWVSLREVNQGQALNRNQLAIDFLQELNSILPVHFSQGFSVLRQEWEAAHLWQGKTAYLSTVNQSIKGKIIGVANCGGLKFLLEDGVEQIFSGGELSLRVVSA